MTLVATELALTLILLTGAGLLVRSFTNLLAVPPGFDTEHLLTFTTSVPQATYREPAARAAFLERAAQAFELLPGVRAVTMSTTLPVSGRGSGAWFTMVDRPWPRGHTPPFCWLAGRRAWPLNLCGRPSRSTVPVAGLGVRYSPSSKFRVSSSRFQVLSSKFRFQLES